MATGVPRSLLVLKPSSFGDIIHTLPAVSRLKAAWPNCRITWLANTEWMPLLTGNPAVDVVIEYPRREFRGWGGARRMWGWLRSVMARQRPDLALDFQGLLRSAVAGRMSRARMFAGLSDSREGARWFYHRTISVPPQPVHAVARYLALADAMLSDVVPANTERCEPLVFPLPIGRRPSAVSDLPDDYILIHPFARGNNKSLSQKDLNSLISEIREKSIVLAGRCDSSFSADSPRCLDLLNRTTLDELIWLVRHASFVVSVDSGPAHLAAALGRPMVAIHSWSDPRRVGPYRDDAWVWKNRVLTRVSGLPGMGAEFFVPKPLHLEPADLENLARLATSPSDFSA